MKKLTSVVIVLAMFCFVLCGCSGLKGDDPKDAKATVNGKQLSANEIIEETKDDPMAFYNNYAEKKVEVTGTVKSVSEIYTTILSREVKVHIVVLEEGWGAKLLIADNPDLENIRVGDSVTITSRMELYDSANEYISLEDIAISGTGSNSKYSDKSTIVKN